MMQQSKGLGGCRFNPWPTAREVASRTPGPGRAMAYGVPRWLPSPRHDPSLRLENPRGTCARSSSSAAVPTDPSRRRSATSSDVALSSVELTRFSNDCLQAQLQANCRQRDVYIVQPLVPPTQEHLMELLLMIDAARGASAAQITAVIPYYAYARSDKKDASRLSIGGQLVADMLSAAGVDRVITMTLHAPQVHAFFSVPVDHLTALGVLADHYLGQDLERRRRRLTGLRQRQDRHPVRPAARAAGRRGQQEAAGRRPGRHRQHRRRRGGQARDRPRRRDRDRRLDRRAARAARRAGLHRGRRSPAPTGCSWARPWTGCASTR